MGGRYRVPSVSPMSRVFTIKHRTYKIRFDCGQEFDLSDADAPARFGTILIVILILAFLGALPRWSHSRDWGYAPTSGVGFVLFVVVVLIVLRRI